jgi:ATP-dependent DNA helicase RecG
MVEVGVDLPNADIMVIQSAERFGLSSLHQLRGRVGRQGQASHCLLFSSQAASTTNQRLQHFTKEKDGLKLAQIDLEQRGAGNLLGYEQSGLQGLRFASWTNLTLIENAQAILRTNPTRTSLIAPYLEKVSKNTITTATN